MSLDKEILDNAREKKFTDFSNAVKQELKNKLSNNKVTKQYVSDFEKIEQMKSTFAKISNSSNSSNSSNEPGTD